jgi:hypothetical protein
MNFEIRELFSFWIGKKFKIHVFNAWNNFGKEQTGYMTDYDIGPVFIRVYNNRSLF